MWKERVDGLELGHHCGSAIVCHGYRGAVRCARQPQAGRGHRLADADPSSYYEELLKAEVHLHRFQSPVLLHSKILSIDDDIAVIGSSNMNLRSFQLDLEVTLVCYDTRIAADMQQVLTDYLGHSRLLRLDEWQARPLLIKLFDNLACLTSALQ